MVNEGFDETFQQELAVQSWSLYGVGMFIVLLRSYARWRRLRSFALFDIDDWLMITAVPMFYTALIVCLNVIAQGGGSNLYLPEEFETFTQDDIEDRIKGSKIVIVSEQAMLNVIWVLKVCMLFMYARMTVKTLQMKFIKYLAVYVALGWIAVEITFFTACRPFKGYWGMPPPDPQCTTLEHYAVVQAVFNLSSDTAMLLIPIPMVLGLKLPLKQKLMLALLFGMGTFVIIAAILTKVYNLSNVYDTAYMLWYTREASVAVYVANLPGIWPLLREHFRFLRNASSYNQGSSALEKYGSQQYGNASRMNRSRVPTARMGTQHEDEIELGRRSFSNTTSLPDSGPSLDEEESIGHFGGSLSEKRHTRPESMESDERALNSGSMEHGLGILNLEVHVDKTIEVQRTQDQGKKMGLNVVIHGGKD